MMSNLRSTVDTKIQSISQFFIQTLLISILALTAPQVFAVTMDKNFDHYNTNFPLDGAHKTKARCDSCHKRGIFKGTPRACETCHGANSKIATTTMSNKHVRVIGECDTCHTQNAWTAVRMDHSAVSGTCKSCHGIVKGVTAPPPNHYKQDCGECHRTRAWKPAKFGHAPNDTNCVLCHSPSGKATRFKSSSHIAVIGQDCSICHSNTRPSFIPISVKPMPHDGVVSTNCINCHKKNPAHIQLLVQDCTACHGSDKRSFKPISVKPMPHDGFVSTNCSLCHGSDLNAPAFHTQAINNFQANGTCSACHSDSKNWKNAPMDHSYAKISQCKSCHASGAQTKGKKNSEFPHGSFMIGASTSACDSCHGTPAGRGGSFGEGTLQKTNMPHDRMSTALCSFCHDPGRTKYTTKTIGEVANHSRVTSSTRCGSCHDKPGGTFKRTLIRGATHDLKGGKDCKVCHASTVTYPQSGKKLGSGGNHQAFATDGADCRSCHTTTRYKDRLDHGIALNGSNCRACHLDNVTYPIGRRKQRTERDGDIGHSRGAQCNVGNGCHTSTGGGSWGAGV